jgi:hypothetical protein
MPHSRYVMRDLNGRKIDDIMQFNVARRGVETRSLFEFGVFAVAVVAYLWILALTS